MLEFVSIFKRRRLTDAGSEGGQSKFHFFKQWELFERPFDRSERILFRNTILFLFILACFVPDYSPLKHREDINLKVNHSKNFI